jgi:ferric-dicitrate binding protein FerR (iron transport regulator)
MDRKVRQARRFRTMAQWSSAAAVLVGAIATWRLGSERLASTRAAVSASPPNAESQTAAPVAIAIAIASGTGAIVAAPGSSTPAVAGRALQAGSRLMVDPGAGATLSLSTGTRLAVEPRSQLTVVEDGRTQIFALNTGSLRADVAKLSPSERFMVRTSDAEIEVRGTSFLVDVVPSDPSCGGGTTTRVIVYEGVVAVRANGGEDAIKAGEHWPRGCRQPAPPVAQSPVASKRQAKVGPAAMTNSPFAPASAPLAAPTVAASPVDVQSLPVPPPLHEAAPRAPSSALVEENDLFAEGMLARRYGNLRLALEKMERFLDRFPSSHLAENAAAERLRLLHTLDPPKAGVAARYYLQRYPNGFARADAEGILAGTR